MTAEKTANANPYGAAAVGAPLNSHTAASEIKGPAIVKMERYSKARRCNKAVEK